ncbi:hypothetical protein ABE65_011160 [Fictibacillus phosphorivorans]|uniref:Uncharacterized protein n=1 Tax=Fictibacillus phosphorivorans TaxID=1221500 RepID=A0A160IMB6_9BACL|nr:hypothetical protein ABE65_011160 [Fictibacillus phosphorivorans]
MNQIFRLFFTIVFNLIFGYLFHYLFILFVLLYLYIAEALGWSLDPTLEEGLLIPVLFLTIVISIIYFSIIVLTNVCVWKKTKIKKIHFLFIIILTFSAGFILNGERMDLLIS